MSVLYVRVWGGFVRVCVRACGELCFPLVCMWEVFFFFCVLFVSVWCAVCLYNVCLCVCVCARQRQTVKAPWSSELFPSWTLIGTCQGCWFQSRDTVSMPIWGIRNSRTCRMTSHTESTCSVQLQSLLWLPPGSEDKERARKEVKNRRIRLPAEFNGA